MTETLLAGREANYNSQRAQPPWASPPRLRCLDKGTLGFEFDSSEKKVCEAQRGLHFLMAARNRNGVTILSFS